MRTLTLLFLIACGTDAAPKGGGDGGATDPVCVAEIPHDGIDQDCDGSDLLDGDGDGVDADFAGGTDCDDTDPLVHPGADDACYDGLDADCDGSDDFDCDRDGVQVDDDCDDTDPLVHPGADDPWYDGIDSDCDGADDFDADADGHAAMSAGGDDCDDTDPDVHPGAEDAWYDGIDSDCDGADDYDADADGFPVEDDCDDADPALTPADRDVDGVSTCDGDCDDADDRVAPHLEDVCDDGLDNDCSGWVDDGCPLRGLAGRTYVADADEMDIVEPELFAEIAAEFLDALLIEVVAQDERTLSVLATQGEDHGGFYVPNCEAVVAVDDIDFRANPTVVMGPVDIVFSLDGLDLPAWDFTLEGEFSDAGDVIRDLRVSAMLDIDAIDIGLGMSTCDLALLIGVPCIPCPDGRPACAELVATAERAEWDPDEEISESCP